MDKARLYIAEHEETGEIIRGTAEEVAAQLGVAATTIYKVQIEGRKVKEHWHIRKEGVNTEPKPEWKFHEALLAEWDAVTAQIRGKGK